MVFTEIRKRTCSLPKRLLASVFLSVALGFVLAFVPLLPSSAIPVLEVPNPREASGTWVSDMADLISDRTESQLNQIIAALEAQNGTEIAVVTVPDTQPSPTPKAFATELFNTWGIGKADADNGVLFLVSKGERRTEIETGYGVRDRLNNAKISAILEQQVTPQFKAGNFDAGILAGTEAIVDTLVDMTGDVPTGTSNLSPPQVDYWGWIVSNRWICVVAISAITTTQLKKLEKSLPNALKIAPTGRSELSAASGFFQPLKFWLLRILVGPEMVQTKGLSLESPTSQNATIQNTLNLFKPQSNTLTNTPSDSAHVNKLAAYQRSNALVKSGQKIFFTLLGLSFLAAVLFKAAKIELILAAWLWLGYEVALSSQSIASIKAESQTDSNDSWQRLAVKYFFQVNLAIFLILLLLLIVLQSLVVLVLPFLSVALLGSCAGLLRLVRSLPEDTDPENTGLECEDCNELMQRLNNTQLQQHLSEAEKTEIQLRNKSYEGWCCPNCSLDGFREDLHIHLFSTLLNHTGYEECRTCDALTVQVEPEILINATTTSKGKKLIKKRCHCCGDYQEQEISLPKVSRSSNNSGSSHLSSYSSSDYSGSSYSSGSSSSSVDSFGGGSSGGDGAGSDW